MRLLSLSAENEPPNVFEKYAILNTGTVHACVSRLLVVVIVHGFKILHDGGDEEGNFLR
jgi:hypothetical protein